MTSQTEVASETAPATDGQRDHIGKMLQSAVPLMVQKYLTSYEGGVRLIDRGSEAMNDMRDAVRAILEKYAVSDRYKNEEAPSTYGYSAGYTGPKSIATQIETIAKIFGLDSTHALALLMDEALGLPLGGRLLTR